MAATFEDMEIASWSVGDDALTFPVKSIRQSGGNRIVERERPYRDGAKLDDTGSKSVAWVVEVEFNNSIQEQGLESNGMDLYPDVLDALIASFDVHETGDLVLPTVGKRRCKAELYDRTERYEARDEACVTFTFREDNEDSVDFRQPLPPSAGSSAPQLADQASFSAQSAGVWHPSLAQFRTFMSQLETIANTPNQVATDLRYAADTITRTTQRTLAAFRHAGDPARDMFCRPAGNRAERQMVRARDMAGRTAGQARAGEPLLVAVILTVDSSLFAVSAATGQSVDDLLDFNPQLDPTFIPSGTTVLVRSR